MEILGLVMKYKNLTIVGSSHISPESVVEVTHAIYDLKPDIVAVELDNSRYHALHQSKSRRISLRDIRSIGIKGYIFAVIAQYVQNSLSKYTGVKPGSDMLTAVRLARHNKLKIALIDQDIHITLQKLSKAITWREKWNFVADIFRGIFFRKREMKKLGIDNLDLTKVPGAKLIKKLMKQLHVRYPEIYKVLISERNVVMAKRLKYLMDNNTDKKILAVVGAGHSEDLIKLLKKYSSTKVDIVGGKLTDKISYSFSVTT
jgi:pheromone shutdown-related protein TraB